MDILFTHDIYEWTTAITNVLWGFVIFILLLWLDKASEKKSFKVILWELLLLLLFLVNALAFFVHGMNFSVNTDYAIWAVMNLMLGLMVALMTSAAVYDYFNKEVMLKFLPYSLICALVFFTVTQVYRDTFLIFVVYQAVFTLLVFAMYIHLIIKKFVGAKLVGIGVFFLILASAAQAVGRYELNLFIPFNQDGVFHILAIPGTILMIMGVVKNIKSY